MSAINVSLPDSLLKQATTLAQKENISINQLIALALAEKLSALMTEDYLEERAKRGDKEKFDRAMQKVAKVEPEDFDRLPQ